MVRVRGGAQRQESGGGFGGIDFGQVGGGEALKFAADEVGGKSGAEERTVERGDFLVVDLFSRRETAIGFEFAFDALANHGGGIGLRGGFFESGIDLRVGDAAGAQFAGDAELALLAGLGAIAGELPGVGLVVEAAGFLEAGENDADQEIVASVAGEFLLHFLHGMGAAHERAQGDVVEFFFGFELAGTGAGEHERENEVRK